MATDITINPAAGMPPVETQSTGTNSSTSVSGIVQSPAAALAEKQAQGELENVANTEAEVAPALEKSLAAKSTAQNLIAANAETGINEVNDLVKARQPILDQAQREADAAEQSFANHKFHDYFSDKTTGDKIVARLAIGLNAFGNGILGVQGNAVADRLQHAIDLDFKKQEKELYSKEKMAEWKRQGVKDLYGRLNDEIATLKMKQALAHEAVAAKAEAMMTQAGIPLEVAKQNVISAQRRADAFKYRAENKQRLEQKVDRQIGQTASTQVTTAKNTQGSESQAKFALLGEGLADNIKIIKNGPKFTDKELEDIQAAELSTQGADETAAKGGISGMVTGAAVSAGRALSIIPKTKYDKLPPEKQKVLNAWDDSVEKISRLYSGAGMRPDESRSEALRDAPRPGDSPELIAQKLARVEATANRLRGLAGNAEARVNAVNSGAPAAKPSIPAGAKLGTRKSDGKRGYLFNGKFHALEQ